MEIMRKQKCICKLSSQNHQKMSLIKMLRHRIEKVTEERNEKSQQLRELFEDNPEIQDIFNSIDEKYQRF